MLKYVLKQFFNNKKSFILIVILLITFIITSISPYLTGLFVDFLISNKNRQLVVYLSILIMVIGIMEILLSYLKNIMTVKITSKVSFDMLSDITQYFERVRLEIVEKNDPIYVTQQINTDVNVLSGFVIANFVSIPLNMILAIAIVCLYCSISKILLLLMVLLIVPYILLYFYMHAPLYKSFLEKKEADSTFFSRFSSQIKQIFNIQLHSLYKASEKELKYAFEKFLPVLVKTKKIEYIFSSIDNVISTIFQSIMFVVGGISIIDGKMTIGQFTMVNTYFGIFLKVVKYYINFCKDLQDAKASYARILKIKNYESIENGKIEIENIKSVGAKNIKFSYHTDKKTNVVFNGFTYEFFENNIYSVVGPNGSGKSTLLKIITGLYTEVDGKILINGKSLQEINGENLRENMFSVVPQHLYLSSENVSDFLTKSLKKNEEEIENMLNQDAKNLYEYVKTVKNNFAKPCGSLSGGEFRKVNLWMALHKSADVLILDEPTMELDKQSKSELFVYLKGYVQGKIVIIMTHDQELMAISDYIVEL